MRLPSFMHLAVVRCDLYLAHHTDGLSTIYQTEGMKGLYRGTLLALVGVSNGALQFMAYERIKVLAFKQKRRSFRRAGKPWTAKDDKLVGFHFHVDPRVG